MLLLITNIGIAFIALLHFWFLMLEMFFWQKPLGLKVFHTNQEFASQSAALAANQGLYNGFLSAGLIWSLFSSDPAQAFHLKFFFLSCITLAGIFAAITVNLRILYVQALPALLMLILLMLTIVM